MMEQDNGWDFTPLPLLVDDYYKQPPPPEVCEMRQLSAEEFNYDTDVISFDNFEDKFTSSLLFDEYRLEPVGSYLTRQYSTFSAPPYFKRDHPDDDLFLKQLGDAQIPWRSQLNYPKHADEPLIKYVVALIIWQDTKHFRFWKNLRKMSPPDQDDSLYSHIIQGAASMVYFLYTQANLFKIGHELTMDKQMDKIFTKAKKWCEKGTPIDEACELLIQLTADKDEFSFVTENHLADMLCYYAIDIRNKKFGYTPTVKVNLHPNPKDKDQLFDDIAKVVRKVELSPDLKADEYTHWMMMFLREEATQEQENLIYRAIGDNPIVKLPQPSEDNNPMIKRAPPSDEALLGELFTLLIPLLVEAKDRMKQELLNVVQPLYAIVRLHQCKVCTEISETIQVADLHRMSLGSRFIGRSHLIWAFYKLGYALPLEIRNTINIFDSDEDHPPYHIYKAALKLVLCSGEKMMQLDHFIYAVLNSKEIDSDGERATEFYQDFKDFQKALESMETEIEPKSTVTVRPCSSLDIFSDSRDDSHNTEECTTSVEPKSSENSSTDYGDTDESII